MISPYIPLDLTKTTWAESVERCLAPVIPQLVCGSMVWLHVKSGSSMRMPTRQEFDGLPPALERIGELGAAAVGLYSGPPRYSAAEWPFDWLAQAGVRWWGIDAAGGEPEGTIHHRAAEAAAAARLLVAVEQYPLRIYPHWLRYDGVWDRWPPPTTPQEIVKRFSPEEVIARCRTVWAYVTNDMLSPWQHAPQIPVAPLWKLTEEQQRLLAGIA